jgi:hypothetical protein
MIYQKKGKATADDPNKINAIFYGEIAELKIAANFQSI